MTELEFRMVTCENIIRSIINKEDNIESMIRGYCIVYPEPFSHNFSIEEVQSMIRKKEREFLCDD